MNSLRKIDSEKVLLEYTDYQDKKLADTRDPEFQRSSLQRNSLSMRTFSMDKTCASFFDYTKPRDGEDNVKTMKDFQEIIRMEKETENVKMVAPLKDRSFRKLTKGMFKCDIPSPGRLYVKSRNMMKHCKYFFSKFYDRVPKYVC